jgi:hypothetical protein
LAAFHAEAVPLHALPISLFPPLRIHGRYVFP